MWNLGAISVSLVLPMVRRAIIPVLLAACAAPASTRPDPVEPAAPPPAPVAASSVEPLPPPDPDRARLDLDWATARLDTDAEAIAVWRRILPTGTDWELRLAQIPDAAVVPLAAALLRGGNFACAPLVGGGCTPGYLGFPDPAPDATFDDPCLRRAAAFWALSNLDTAAVAQLAPALIAIAAAPANDDDLVGAVVVAAGEQPEALRLDVLRAAAAGGHVRGLDDELGELSDAALAVAATELHIDAAVLALDAGLSRPTFLAAVRDRALLPDTRIAAIKDLVTEAGAPLPRDLVALFTEATRDPDCRVAAHAAIALATAGKPDALPRRPRSRKTADAMRALCVLAAADELAAPGAVDAADAFVGPSGLQIVERTYDGNREFAAGDDDDADGDHDPRTNRTVITTSRKDLEVIPFNADIARATCTATTCTLPGGIELAFAWKPARDGGLWLDAIERRDRGDCGTVP
jgi:hypothetical protein